MSDSLAKRFRELVDRNDYRAVAGELVELEAERGAISIVDLGDDPEAAVANSPELELQYSTDLAGDCSVYGLYRYRHGQPSVIFVRPSDTTARDRFTIVHEYGHHVQRHHRDWTNIRYALPANRGDKVEEHVADAFAAAVLIPESVLPTGGSEMDARTLSSIHSRHQASRSAVASRLVELTQDRHATVVVCDEEGRVSFARASGDDVFTPARGILQPALASAFEAASAANGTWAGALPDSLWSASGWGQSDLTADVALDYSGDYAFVVLRPIQVFGRVQQWELQEYECVNLACESVFVVDSSVEICRKCGEPKCPECSTCCCPPAALEICSECFMALSLAEMSGQIAHICD